MCLWCGSYAIVEVSVGDVDILLCRCDGACENLSAYLTSRICEECRAFGELAGCYRVRAIEAINKRNENCRNIIREMTRIWVVTCYDFMFMSKSYVNKLYFRSEFTKRLREHFGYNVRMSLHRAPFEQVTAFIRRVQHYNIIALADALERVFERIFTDVMLSEEGFAYPRAGGMMFCSSRDDKTWLAHDSLRMLRW